MKYSQFIVVALLIILVNTTLYAGYFKDVPTDHWAYKQAVALSKLGILKGYPDGTFKGEQNVTRYQLAVALYNMVIYLQEYVADKTKNLVEVSSLYSLRSEISEIADMASKAYKWSSENTKSIQELQKTLTDLKVHTVGGSSGSSQDMDEILNEIMSLKTEFDNKLQQFDVKCSKGFDDAQKRLKSLEGEIKELRSLLNSLAEEKKAVDYSEDIETLNRKYNELDQRLSKLEDMYEATSSRENKEDKSLSIDLYSIRKDLIELQNKYSSLQERMSNLATDVENLKNGAVSKENFEQLKNAFDGYKNDLEKLRVSVAKLQDDVKGIMESINVVEGDLNSYKLQSSKTKEMLEDEISSIKTSLNAVEVELKALEEEVHNIKASSVSSNIIYSYLFSAVLFLIGIAAAIYF